MFYRRLLLLLYFASTTHAGLENVTAVVKSNWYDDSKILVNVDIKQMQGYKQVMLTNCTIPTLKAGNLSNLEDVEVLGLVAIGLEWMGVGTFDGLYKIKLLHILGNKLRVISGGVFNDHGFVTLDLRENHIEKIQDASFRYMENLRTLDLSVNNISYIHPEAFMDTDNLEELNLSKNNFHGKFPKFIAALWKLRIVDLSHNRIETIAWDSVLGLGHLKRLILNNNHIRTIADGSFADLDGLMFLELFYNRLECVSHDNLYSLREYASVYLAKNKITDECRERLVEFRKSNPNVYIYY